MGRAQAVGVGVGLVEGVGRKDQNPGRGSLPGDAYKSRVGRKCKSREVL